VKLGKAGLAIIGATVLLGALTASASARTLSTSSQTLRAAFSAVTFRGAFGNIVCAVTVEGSFHSRTQAKVVNSLTGLITRAELGTCATGSVTLLRETLPWHIRYDSFTGVLPNITNVKARVVGVMARAREPLITCLLTSTEEAPATITFNRDVATRAITTAQIGGTGIETTCGRAGTFESDRANVTVLGAATRITLTLI
jgi:hypothetical protein